MIFKAIFANPAGSVENTEKWRKTGTSMVSFILCSKLNFSHTFDGKEKKGKKTDLKEVTTKREGKPEGNMNLRMNVRVNMSDKK